MEQIRERDEYFDTVKGVLAWLVVLGHCIQYYYTETYSEKYFFNFIYGFHMPLFVLTSGYASSFSKDINLVWIIKRAKRLLIPFFFWAFLCYFITNPFYEWNCGSLIHTFIEISFINPSSGGLAFLVWIFGESLLLFLLSKSTYKSKIILICGIISIIWWSIGVNIYYFAVRYVVLYFPWFFFGFYIGNKDYINRLKKNRVFDKIRSIMTIVLLFVYIAIIIPYQYAHTYLLITGWPENIRSIINSILTGYIVPIIGSGTILCIVSFLPRKFKEIFKHLGLYTMEIYIIHSRLMTKIMYAKTAYPVIEIIIKSVILTVVCLAITYFVRKSKWANRVLFGGSW